MITFRQFSQATASGAAVTILPPSGIKAGDLLVAGIQYPHGQSISTPPAGWTLADSIDGGTGSVVTSIYWRIAGPIEAVQYKWALSASVLAQGAIVAYYGAQAFPVDVSGHNSGTGTTLSTPTITTQVNDLLLLAYSAAEGPFNSTSPHWGSNFATIRADVALEGALRVADFTSAGGDTGPWNITDLTSEAWTAQAIAFKPLNNQVIATLVTRDGSGNPQSGQVVGFRLYDPQQSGDEYSRTKFTVTSDATGLVAVTLVAGALYQMLPPGASVWSDIFSTPASGTFTLPEVLGAMN